MDISNFVVQYQMIRYYIYYLTCSKKRFSRCVVIPNSPLVVFVYVIARVGVKFGINFTSYRENGSEITRGAAECNFTILATTSGIYPKISLQLVLSQINTIASFIKSQNVFKLASTLSNGFLLFW